MSSSRLPGKVLKDLGPGTALEVLARRLERRHRGERGGDRHLRRARTTIRSPSSCAVGPARWSAGRSTTCSSATGWPRTTRRCDAVVRITSDCPLAEPEVIDRVIRLWRERRDAGVRLEHARAALVPRRAGRGGGLPSALWRRPRPRRAIPTIASTSRRSSANRPERFPQRRLRLEPPVRTIKLSLDTPEDLDRDPGIRRAGGPGRRAAAHPRGRRRGSVAHGGRMSLPSQFAVGERLIGDGGPTYVIAEVGLEPQPRPGDRHAADRRRSRRRRGRGQVPDLLRLAHLLAPRRQQVPRADRTQDARPSCWRRSRCPREWQAELADARPRPGDRLLLQPVRPRGRRRAGRAGRPAAQDRLRRDRGPAADPPGGGHRNPADHLHRAWPRWPRSRTPSTPPSRPGARGRRAHAVRVGVPGAGRADQPPGHGDPAGGLRRARRPVGPLTGDRGARSRPRRWARR